MTKKITVSLETLFNVLSGFDNEEEHIPLEHDGYIQKEVIENENYYDLKNKEGIPCMDGETCEVIEETSDFVFLYNDKTIDKEGAKLPFKLSKKEFDIACTKID